MELLPVLVAAGLISLVTGHVAGGRDVNVPTKLSLSDKYHVKGEQEYITVGIVEPFELWYDGARNVSRKDVYNGTVKYLYDLNFNTSSVKKHYVHPETDSRLKVSTKCSLEILPKKEFKSPEFLPKTEKFVYKGKDKYQSKIIDVWELIKYDEELGTTEHHQLYVSRKDAYEVPVRYTIKSFGKLKKGLFSYSIINYYDYEPNVHNGDLDLKSNDFIQCSNTSILNERVEDDEMGFDLDTTFHGYKKQHGKDYKDEEHKKRKNIFKSNVKYITEHNQQELSYKLAVNQFADRSDEEIAGMGCLLPMSDHHQLIQHSNNKLKKLEASELPEELDLRAHGLVTSIKNQLNCGSCWAFTTAATVEVALALRNGGTPIELSEQSLIDCSWSEGNSGCDGGLSHNALQFILEQGIPSDEDYGLYKMEDGICHLNSVPESKRHKIKDWEILVPSDDISVYQTAIVKFGALAVNIYASKNLLLYAGGLFYDSECAAGKEYALNHAVTIVGYGVENGTTYWLVKNSWGADWGEAGYVRFPAADNNCGLMLFGIYAVA